MNRRVLTLSRAVGAAAILFVAAVEARPGPPSSEGGSDPAAREVTLKTSDGLQIASTYWPTRESGKAGVVLLHMLDSDRGAWEPVVGPLRTRGVSVLAIDLRGHGKSAKQGKADLSIGATKRDAKWFAGMHEDAIAAVRWLAKEGKCDPKRIALGGAGVGGSIAFDTVSRYPGEIAAVVGMTPAVKEVGLDTLIHLKKFPAATPLLLLVHRTEIAEGAQKIVDARPSTRFVVYDDEAPAEAGAEKAWAQGTRMFGRLPLVERTVASFVAAATGSKTEDVVLDGIVATEGPNADPWSRAVDVGEPGGTGTARAFRVGRRVVFGGTAATGVMGLRFEVQTGDVATVASGVTMLGPPQVVAVDLPTGRPTWTWGGMSSMPNLPGLDMTTIFGKTVPLMRSVASDGGTTFEGEWIVPKMGGESPLIRILIRFDADIAPQPRGGAVEVAIQHAVDLPSR